MYEKVFPTVDYQCIQTNIQDLQVVKSMERTEPRPRFDHRTAHINLEERK
jgi:hypothetical protein